MVEELEPIEGLRIFPNPADNSFSVNFNLLNDANVTIDVVDVTGKQLAGINVGERAAGMCKQELSVKDLSLTSGVYFINVSIDGATISRKLIIRE